jgi:phosphoserine phosphatase
LHAEAKAECVREVAEKDGLDLAACTAYSDSHTDLPFLEAVGHPVAANPDRALRRIAAVRGWPVLQFGDRAYPHARRRVPPALVAAGAAGVAAILATRSRGR